MTIWGVCMRKVNFVNIVISSLLFSSVFLCAEENFDTENMMSNTKNKREFSSIEKGFNYWEGTETKKEDKESILKVLQEIRKENQEQTKIQKEILKQLKTLTNPEPKKIVVNGKECIANSSAECFDVASLLTPEAQKVPALAAVISDPYDINKVVTYKKWQDKLLELAGNLGNGFQIVEEQFGDEASLFGVKRSSYDNSSGLYDSQILPQAKHKYIESLSHLLSFKIFLGMNENLDLYALSALSDIIHKYQNLRFEFIFKDNKSKEIFENGMNVLFSTNNKNWNTALKKTAPETFNKFGIYTTPSIVAILNNNNSLEGQTIATGRVTYSMFTERVLNFLEYKKVIDYKKLSDYKIWENSGDFAEDFYKRNFNIDITKNPNILINENGGKNENK